MKKITFDKIDELVALSQLPTTPILENLPGEHHAYHRFLYHLASQSQPETALELGIWHGLGSMYMAHAASEYGGKVIGVDLNAMEWPLKNFEFIHGDTTSKEIANKVISKIKGKIGMVFQDSSHHYLASKKEWEIYSDHLDENAIWVCGDITPAFHDSHIDPPGKGMIQYFDELPGEKRLYNNLHQGNRIGVILL